MARVPTWTELRMDATKLNQLQKECYLGVHRLLDIDLPELDRKISLLKGRPREMVLTFSDPSLADNVARHNDYPKRTVSKEVLSHRVVTPLETREPKIEELEHLKPLPSPLSYYFRINRPVLVMRFDGRRMYLKNKSERRKQLASTRIINSLEQIRLSSRNSINRLPKQTRKDPYLAPKYQVQCRLSEHEMKRLTAKTYKRLPEVKRRRLEEFSNHMKVQNYKNKLEYGRKLLENRRHGIINYPLRSSCDDRSISSSQSDYSLNGRAADPFRSDPYF